MIVRHIASFLKKSGKVKVPDWADVVKLAKHKELTLVDPDWYYVCAASIARRLCIRSLTYTSRVRPSRTLPSSVEVTRFSGRHRHAAKSVRRQALQGRYAEALLQVVGRRHPQGAHCYQRFRRCPCSTRLTTTGRNLSIRRPFSTKSGSSKGTTFQEDRKRPADMGGINPVL